MLYCSFCGTLYEAGDRCACADTETCALCGARYDEGDDHECPDEGEEDVTWS